MRSIYVVSHVPQYSQPFLTQTLNLNPDLHHPNFKSIHRLVPNQVFTDIHTTSYYGYSNHNKEDRAKYSNGLFQIIVIHNNYMCLEKNFGQILLVWT